MKTILLTSPDETIKVQYLTDLIGDAQECTVYQIQQIVDGQPTIGLSDAAISAGLPDKIEPTTLQTFKTFAIDNYYSLDVYETGEVTESLIYYGGAIGEDSL